MYDILMIEDETELAELLEIYMEKAGYTVRRAASGEEALVLLQEESAKLLLLDITLPGMDGFAVCSKVRKSGSIPILIISARVGKEDKLNGFLLGADDYITKPFNPLELLARVKSQMRRYTTLGSIAEKSNIIKIGGLELDKDAKEVRVEGEKVKLTATEYGILQLLMENAGKVFSIDQIYESVWNELSFAPENTVSVHIRRIREKIEINPKEPRYLKVVWGIGYKIEKN